MIFVYIETNKLTFMSTKRRIKSTDLYKQTINLEGIVNFFSKKFSFGYIQIKNSRERRVFVHESQLLQPIKDDDHVKFDIADGEKGPVAINVKLS